MPVAVKKGSAVKKSLTPEEIAILADIEALMGKLKATAGAGETEEPDEASAIAEALKAANAEGDESGEEEDEDVEKATGSDGAEERLKDDPEEGKEALSLLKSESGKKLVKAIYSLAKSEIEKKGSKVEKVAVVEDQNTEVMKALTTAIQTIATQVEVQGKALEGIMEGIGVTEVMKSEEKTKKKPSNGSMNTADVQKALRMLLGGTVEKEEDPDEAGTTEGIGTVLKSLAAMGPARVE